MRSLHRSVGRIRRVPGWGSDDVDEKSLGRSVKVSVSFLQGGEWRDEDQSRQYVAHVLPMPLTITQMQHRLVGGELVELVEREEESTEACGFVSDLPSCVGGGCIECSPDLANEM
jgi:hypothetical protein